MKADEMRQLDKFPGGWSGCKANDFFDGHDLAVEAWGERSKISALASFAYFWRRFGPPWQGCDNHKAVAAYHLTTSDPEVVLWFTVSASELCLGVGAIWHQSLEKLIRQPTVDWQERFYEWWADNRHPEIDGWEDTAENRAKVSDLYWSEVLGANSAEMFAQAEAGIGPCPKPPRPADWRKDSGAAHRINAAVFGALKELERPVFARDVPINIFGVAQEDVSDEATVSEYAGYGVPKEAMDALISSRAD